MNTKVTLDKAGRLVLPKAIREALQVGPGDTLELRNEDGRVVISPVLVRPGLQKERGVWVYRSGNPVTMPIPELVDGERDRRTRELVGSGS